MDSNGDSCYRTEPTVFDSNANSDTDSGINCDTNSTAESESACKVSTQVWLHKDQDHPLEYYLNQLKEFKESDFMTQDYANSTTNLLDCTEEHWY